jgi:FkbM family methyltransferase
MTAPQPSRYDAPLVVRRALFSLFSALFRRIYGTRVADLIWKIPGSSRLYPLLIGRLKPDTVTVFGHRIELDPRDSLLLSINGVYEETEARLFERSIRPGDIVLDIGAHIGYYTLLAARAAGADGRVFAFEPERQNYGLLTRNVANNGYTNVSAINQAVMATSGAQTLFVSEDNAGDHHLYAGSDDRSSYEVAATSIDDFFAERSKTVNVIKIDVQGTEPFVLRGMTETLKANERLLLFTELAPGSLQDAGTSAREYIEALRDAGFDLHVIDESTGRIAKTSAEQLLSTADFGRENHINILCSKGDAAAIAVGAGEQTEVVRTS